MINRTHLKNFAKFEAKKREKLGDKAFLEKYIRSFINSDKLMKTLLPVLLILNAINMTVRIIWFITNNTFDFIMMIFGAITTVCWIFVAIAYYTHHFKFHKAKIAEWTEELNKINNSENTDLPNNM